MEELVFVRFEPSTIGQYYRVNAYEVKIGDKVIVPVGFKGKMEGTVVAKYPHWKIDSELLNFMQAGNGDKELERVKSVIWDIKYDG